MMKSIIDKLKLASLVAASLLLSSSTLPSSADVECIENTDIGKSLNLPVYEWRDQAVPTKAFIFAIHGATLYAKRFDTAARHFAEEGYPVYALDLRGYGRWRTEGDSFSKGDKFIHYTMSQDDIVQVLSKIRETEPNTKIYSLGESLGANLVAWIGSDQPQLTDGLIMISPCVKSVLHAGPIEIIAFFKGLINHNRRMLLNPYISPYLSEDKIATAEYINDPGIFHVMTPVELVKSIKTNTIALQNVSKIPEKMPVLVLAGKIDKIYKSSAVKPLVSEMGSKCTTVEIIPHRGHLLIEYPRVKPEFLALIDNWLTTGNTIAVEKKVTAATIGGTAIGATPATEIDATPANAISESGPVNTQ